MPTCLIGLGSNRGDRRENLARAVDSLRGETSVQIVAQSRAIETAPVGGPPGQTPFLNATVLLETSLDPEALLAVLRRIEERLGRRRVERWGPRIIDLDLLLYGRETWQSQTLTVPHPRMAWRRFVLEPAVQIAPEMIHPTTGWTLRRLLDHLNNAAPYVAVAGPPGAGKTELVERVAHRTSGSILLDPHDRGRIGAFHANSSGSARAMELEFLDARVRLLSAGLPASREQGRPWISDFWLNQSLAYAALSLASDELEAFRRRCEEAIRTAVRPKLTVVLDVPPRPGDRIDRGGRSNHGLDPEHRERIRRAIVAEAARPGVGPVLRLAAADPAGNADEVVWALQSMGPIHP